MTKWKVIFQFEVVILASLLTVLACSVYDGLAIVIALMGLSSMLAIAVIISTIKDWVYKK